MTVKIIHLKNDEFRVEWTSLENKLENCSGYMLFLKTSRGFESFDKFISATGKSKYYDNIFIKEELLSNLPQQKIRIMVNAMFKENGVNKVSKVTDEGVFEITQ